MPRGLRIGIKLNHDASFYECASATLSQAFRGYFDPHTAVQTLTTATSKNTEHPVTTLRTLGGFKNWQNEQLSSYEMHLPWFRRLLIEQDNIEGLWSTATAPNCIQSILGWIDSSRKTCSWQISIYGNLHVQLIAEETERSFSIFREILRPVSEKSGVVANSNVRSLEKRLSLFSITLEYDLEYDEAWITFESFSDFWLKQGNAFQGDARRTASANLSSLAEKLRLCVAELGDAAVEVTRDAVEGEIWSDEIEMINYAFRIIPKLTVQ